MKKFLAVLLAVITVFSFAGIIAFAADNDNAYTESFSVTVAPDCEKKLAITSLSGSNYVVENGTFRFTAEAINGYVFDQTTVLKVANTSYSADVVLGVEGDYGYILEPDENGVYTVENVTDDLYIYAANLEKQSFAGLKDFLLNMMYFFLNTMKWFFGLD